VNIKCYKNIANLPQQWDKLATNYFQRKEFLEHCERWNPCLQRYYTACENGNLISGAVVYSLVLDLFTFSKLYIPIKVNITGIPCSVSRSGILGTPETSLRLYQSILKREKGLSLALNLPFKGRGKKNMAIGKTLPSITLNRPFPSWGNYLQSLRASYRRRIKSIEKKTESIQFNQSYCNEFNEEMYDLYLQVYNRSNAKLECLNFNFFNHLPKNFTVISAWISNRLAGWAITLFDDQTFYFFFGGVDYTVNSLFDIYFRLLIEVVRSGIETGANSIDLGQTAEIPKLRLGGESIPLYMFATHSNPLYRSVLHSTIGMLQYRRSVPQHRVFKEEP